MMKVFVITGAPFLLSIRGWKWLDQINILFVLWGLVFFVMGLVSFMIFDALRKKMKKIYRNRKNKCYYNSCYFHNHIHDVCKKRVTVKGVTYVPDWTKCIKINKPSEGENQDIITKGGSDEHTS